MRSRGFSTPRYADRRHFGSLSQELAGLVAAKFYF